MLQGGAEGRELRRGPGQAWLQPPSWARHGSRGLRAGDAEPGGVRRRAGPRPAPRRARRSGGAALALGL